MMKGVPSPRPIRSRTRARRRFFTELFHAFEAAANMDLTPGSGHLGPFVAETEFDASSHDDDDSWAGSDALE